MQKERQGSNQTLRPLFEAYGIFIRLVSNRILEKREDRGEQIGFFNIGDISSDRPKVVDLSQARRKRQSGNFQKPQV